MRAFIIDDDPVAVELLCDWVSAEGLDVETFHNGMEMISRCQAVTRDVFVIDNLMPVMSGIEVCRWIKSEPRLADIPVIVESIRDREEDVVAALDAGADDYLTKPLNRSIVAARVRNAIRSKTARDQLRAANLRLEDARILADQASQSKSDWIAMVSHEIRTPMSAILGFANLLQEKYNSSKTEPWIETLVQNGRHVLELVNDLLDLARAESGRLVAELDDCRPMRIAEQVVQLLGRQAMDKGIHLSIDATMNPDFVVRSDERRLRQILVNLVGNSIKFTKKGGVLIRCQCSSERLVWTVSDSGIGMTPEQVDRILQPYVQAGEFIQKHYGGTGLGLSISKRLIDLMKGSLRVESDVGIGTTMFVTIPVEKASVHTPATLEVSTIASPRLAGNVLLADDCKDNRRLLGIYLERMGLEVVAVEDGKEAVECCKNSHFDVVLLDLDMPGWNGHEAREKIWQRGYTGPIAAVSAHAMDGALRAAKLAGFDDFVSKPVDRQSLYQTLTRCLSKRKSPPPLDRGPSNRGNLGAKTTLGASYE